MCYYQEIRDKRRPIGRTSQLGPNETWEVDEVSFGRSASCASLSAVVPFERRWCSTVLTKSCALLRERSESSSAVERRGRIVSRSVSRHPRVQAGILQHARCWMPVQSQSHLYCLRLQQLAVPVTARCAGRSEEG